MKCIEEIDAHGVSVLIMLARDTLSESREEAFLARQGGQFHDRAAPPLPETGD